MARLRWFGLAAMAWLHACGSETTAPGPAETTSPTTTTQGHGGEGAGGEGTGGPGTGGGAEGGGGTGGATSYRSVRLIAPQTYILPSDALAGDDVGEVVSHYRLFHGATPSFWISENALAENFSLSADGKLSVSSMAGLVSGETYSIRVTAHDASLGIGDEQTLAIRVIPAAEIRYVDPTYSGAESGSRAQPFSAWNEGLTAASAAGWVLQRRGTTAASGALDVVGGSMVGVTLGAYGSGPRPVVTLSASGLGIAGVTGVVVRDLEITAPSSRPVIDVSNFCDATTVDNCVLHEGNTGVNMTGSRGLRVVHTEIHHVREDGIYTTGDADKPVSMEVGFTYIHHVNQNFTGPHTSDAAAPGDAMQLNGLVETIEAHHNVMDRSDTGNKFCIISAPRDHTSVISLTYNYCKANNAVTGTTDDPVSGFYLENVEIAGGNANELTIVGNKFEDVNVGILLRDFLAAKIHSNQVNLASTGLSLGANTGGEIFHNLIRGTTTVAIGLGAAPGSFTLENNLFVVSDGVPVYGGSVSSISESDYNLFSSDSAGFVTGYSGLAAWQATGNDAHSAVGAATFVDEPGGNFHLRPSSLGIHAGAELDVSLDIEEQSFATPPHLGPYQFASE